MSSLKTKSTIESGGDNAQMYDKDGLPIYGLDLEIQKKLMAKKDPYREAEAQEWIETVTGEKFKAKDFQESLKDGILLCKLVNGIRENMVPPRKISKAKMAFMQMNNIGHFINACRKLGVPKTDVFTTIDLYEGKNIPKVVDTIFSLGSICLGLKDYDGPTIGKKRAVKTKYEFTEEQLAESRNAGTLLSFGGKGCASQAGTRSISNEVVKTSDTGSREGVSMLNEGGKGCSSQSGTRSISHEVVRTKDTGSRGGVSMLNEGGKGCSSQAGTRSISNEVVKVSKKSSTNNDDDEQLEEVVVEDDGEEVEVEEEGEEVEVEEEGEEVEIEEDGGEEVEVEEGEEVEVEEDVDVDVDVDVEDDEDDEEEDTSLEELEKLAALRDAGEITDEEFAAKKKEILGL